jgi:hypothetical protein
MIRKLYISSEIKMKEKNEINGSELSPFRMI